MTETSVPDSRSHSGGGSHSVGGRSGGAGKTYRVQRASAIRPDDHVLGGKVLHR
jgi:hypothetical protein